MKFRTKILALLASLGVLMGLGVAPANAFTQFSYYYDCPGSTTFGIQVQNYNQPQSIGINVYQNGTGRYISSYIVPGYNAISVGMGQQNGNSFTVNFNGAGGLNWYYQITCT